MAENLHDPDGNEPGIRSRNASKLAILIAFIAGAFAAWIIISANIF